MAGAELKKLMKVLNWKPKMKKSKAEQEAAKRVVQRPAAKAKKPTKATARKN